MKSLQFILAGAIALALTAAADAQTVVNLKLTGSTAYRAQTHQAIRDSLTAGYTFSYTEGTAGDGLDKATASTFKGQIDGVDVVIQAGWTGSVEGIRDVVTNVNNQQAFLPESTATSTAGTATLNAAANEAGKPDVALSDCGQGSTSFATNPVQLVGDKRVGLIPFRFFTNSDAPFSTITAQQIRQLYAAGSLPLSFLTGNPAHNTVDGNGVLNRHVFAAGRNNSSGTRLIMQQETGIGANTSVSLNTLNAARSSFVLTNTNTPGSSGGNLATFVSGPLTGALANNYIVVYVGGSDATSAINGGAKELAYEGSLYGGDNTKVQQGTYTFWGYEQFLYRQSIDDTKKTIANKIAAKIKQNDTVLSGMQVSRPSDGGVISSLLE